MSNFVIREVGSGEVSLVSHFYYKIFETQFDFLPSTEQYFLHACEELFDNPEKNKNVDYRERWKNQRFYLCNR